MHNKINLYFIILYSNVIQYMILIYRYKRIKAAIFILYLVIKIIIKAQFKRQYLINNL